MFKNPFSFDGRIRRTEYGISFIIYLIVYFGIRASGPGFDEPSIYWFGLIPLLWFLWAQGAKRCHDRGNSGWWQLIPFYGFWLLFADSEPGSNQYGPNPKDPFGYHDELTGNPYAQQNNPYAQQSNPFAQADSPAAKPTIEDEKPADEKTDEKPTA